MVQMVICVCAVVVAIMLLLITGININFLDVTKCSLCKTYELCWCGPSCFPSFLKNEKKRSCYAMHRHTHSKRWLSSCVVPFILLLFSLCFDYNQLLFVIYAAVLFACGRYYFAIYMGEIEFGGVVLGMYSFNKSRNRKISLPAAVKSP